MPELSIIVPVYNVATFLSRCLDSILTQSFKDFELIIIDDGSTDSSGRIIMSYASRDNRIISIFKENQGVSSARNKGLAIAKGKYVSFIDADDWIELDMYSSMITTMKASNTNIVCCNWNKCHENGSVEDHHVSINGGLMSVEDFVCHIFDRPRSVGGSICNKIFIRERIHHWFDESVKFCEDNLFLLRYCACINNAYYLNVPFYHIYERQNSATRGTVISGVEILPVREKLVSIASTISNNARYAAESDYLDQCFYYLMINHNSYEIVKIKKYIRSYSRKHLGSILFNKCISWGMKFRYCSK